MAIGPSQEITKISINYDESRIKLETKLVGDITGAFFVPSYQRGYRWGETEVVRLLDDIYATEGKRNYCLQPVVVRKNGDRYELIDGQQRLTTIYLIYRFMNEESFGFIDEPRFTLSYETRDKSEDFLKSIDESRKDENIDFWFLCAAYGSIKKWFAAREEERQERIRISGDYLTNTFRFLSRVYGDGQEMVLFLTELAAGYYSLRFINEHGNEAYFRYNKMLLLRERRSALRDEVIRLMD